MDEDDVLLLLRRQLTQPLEPLLADPLARGGDILAEDQPEQRGELRRALQLARP